MGVLQHLDGISGTEKQEVAFDYAQRISIGIDSAIVSISITSLSNININHQRYNIRKYLLIIYCSRMSSIKLIQNSYLKLVNKYRTNFFVK